MSWNALSAFVSCLKMREGEVGEKIRTMRMGMGAPSVMKSHQDRQRRTNRDFIFLKKIESCLPLRIPHSILPAHDEVDRNIADRYPAVPERLYRRTRVAVLK